MADKAGLIAELKQRVAKISPLEDEPDFITSDETIVRFLKSRDWHLDEAEQMLTETVEYRRKRHPQTLDCLWCHNRPGFHSMRQVGHDEAGRPVLYANFAQASTIKNTTEDSVAHVTYLIENAKRTMAPGVSTWVFVIDCTGMTLSSCNPKLGYGVTNVLSKHYPERLGLVICLNHSPVFNGVWKAMKKFLHPQTAAKVCLVRSKAKMAELFSELFCPELSAWLLTEITLNKQKPLPESQQEFWNPLPGGKAGCEEGHDPRGCPAYVRQYIDTFKVEQKTGGTSPLKIDRRPATPVPRLGKAEAAQGKAVEGKATTGIEESAHGKASLGDVMAPNGKTSLSNVMAPNGKTSLSGVVAPNGKTSLIDVVAPDGKTSLSDVVAPSGKTSPSDVVAPNVRPVYVHRPHPNIVDQLSGRHMTAVALTKEEQQELLKAQTLIEGEGGLASGVEEEAVGELDIPTELQIPGTGVPLTATF